MKACPLKEYVISSVGDFRFHKGDNVGCAVLSEDKLQFFHAEVVEVHYEEIKLFSQPFELGTYDDREHHFDWDTQAESYRDFTPEMLNHVLEKPQFKYDMDSMEEFRQRIISKGSKLVGPDTVIKQRWAISVTVTPVNWSDYPDVPNNSKTPFPLDKPYRGGDLTLKFEDVHKLGKIHFTYATKFYPSHRFRIPMKTQRIPLGERVRRFKEIKSGRFSNSNSFYLWIVGNVVGYRVKDWVYPQQGTYYPTLKFMVKLDKVQPILPDRHNKQFSSEFIEKIVSTLSHNKPYSFDLKKLKLDLMNDWNPEGTTKIEEMKDQVFVDEAKEFIISRFPSVAKDLFLQEYQKAYLGTLMTCPLFGWSREVISKVVQKKRNDGKNLPFWFCFTYSNDDKTGNSYLSRDSCRELGSLIMLTGEGKRSGNERMRTNFMGDAGGAFLGHHDPIDKVGDIVYAWKKDGDQNQRQKEEKVITFYARERDNISMDHFVTFVKTQGKAARFEGKNNDEICSMFNGRFKQLILGYFDPAYRHEYVDCFKSAFIF